MEVTRILAQLPEPGRVRVLQELGEESSAWTILSTLRQRAADSRQEQSDASGSIQSSTGDEMEDAFHGWESQNPVAYPDREGTQPDMMRADGYVMSLLKHSRPVQTPETDIKKHDCRTAHDKF